MFLAKMNFPVIKLLNQNSSGHNFCSLTNNHAICTINYVESSECMINFNQLTTAFHVSYLLSHSVTKIFFGCHNQRMCSATLLYQGRRNRGGGKGQGERSPPTPSDFGRYIKPVISLRVGRLYSPHFQTFLRPYISTVMNSQCSVVYSSMHTIQQDQIFYEVVFNLLVYIYDFMWYIF